MRRALLLTIGLLVAPAVVAAQVEIGMDAALSIYSYDNDAIDSETSIDIPGEYVRIGFPAGETLIVESTLGLSHSSQGDNSYTTILLLPGVNFLVGEQFYVRGEAGLWRGSDGDNSQTQYAFGGAAGLRMPLGDAALFRVEAGVDKWLENEDDFLPGAWDIRGSVGVSAVIN